MKTCFLIAVAAAALSLAGCATPCKTENEWSLQVQTPNGVNCWDVRTAWGGKPFTGRGCVMGFKDLPTADPFVLVWRDKGTTDYRFEVPLLKLLAGRQLSGDSRVLAKVSQAGLQLEFRERNSHEYPRERESDGACMVPRMAPVVVFSVPLEAAAARKAEGNLHDQQDF